MIYEIVLGSRLRGYFCYFKRMDKASVIMSYIFPIHDLIGGWGALVSICQ